MICPKCGLKYTASMHVCAVRKVCSDCGQEKEPQAFGIHPSSFDGRKNRCIPCQAARDTRLKEEKHSRIETERAQRASENALFKAHGYYWRKEFDSDDFEYWQLYAPGHQPISKEKALAKIAALQGDGQEREV